MLPLLLSVALAAAPAGFETGAAEALADYQAACREEGGELWGATLCGPLVIVDPASRRAVANAADFGGALAPRGAVYAGFLPEGHGLANTAFDWDGRRWSMVLWPLPDDPKVRRALLLHEAWHRLQPELGFAAPMVENAHLAEATGRLWLRLEGRALARELADRDAGTLTGSRNSGADHALAFRALRHALHPAAAEQETALELNEGLAQYTGIKAAYGVEARAAAIDALRRADGADTIARSFAYATGPAWGLVLDDLRPGWRQEVGPDRGFAALAAAAREVAWPSEALEEIARRSAVLYGYAEVAAEEEKRAAAARRELERLRAALVEAPALVLPLRQMQMQFDPGGVLPLPPHGSVYRKITIQDLWGEVEVSGEALLAGDFASLSLGGPATLDGRSLRGEGWSVKLADGWSAERTGESGWRLVEPPQPPPP